MRRIIPIVLVMVFSLIVMRSSVFAQDDNYTRKTLKGLNGVYIGGISISEDAKHLGLNKEQIQIFVKSKLGLAGIKLLTEKEHHTDVGISGLYVLVDVLIISPEFLIYDISAKFHQWCHLVRDPEILAWVDTWSSRHFGSFFIKNAQEEIQAQIKHEVDIFINAYLSVNPKT